VNLVQGRHLLFIGPPGSGKTEIAKAVPELLFGINPAPYLLATANAAWSVFDVVGGPQLTKKGTQFVPGLFTQSVIQAAKSDGRFWLILDEINRADIDRALGGVFTTLQDGELRLDAAAVAGTSFRSSYTVSPTFRTIATMNTADKNNLFPLSIALLRRFAVVEFGPPESMAERRLVESRVSQFLIARAGLDASQVSLAFSSLRLDTVIATCLELVARLRAASKSKGGAVVPELQIGSSTLIEIAKSCVGYLLIDPHEVEISLILDAAVQSQLLPQLAGLPSDELDEVAKIFESDDLHLGGSRDVVRAWAMGSGMGSS
jgi:MoxR-like ATPase